MYKIEIKSGAEKQLNKLPDKIFSKINNLILQLKENPRPHNSEKLVTKQGYRIRCENYRILYDINNRNKVVTIFRVKHRKEVYR